VTIARMPASGSGETRVIISTHFRPPTQRQFWKAHPS
jgi:hypothetical protein